MMPKTPQSSEPKNYKVLRNLLYQFDIKFSMDFVLFSIIIVIIFYNMEK